MEQPNLPRNPAQWTALEVEIWANASRLTAATIAALAQNEVDGPTLITLAKSDLKTELGISSLPARRHLWELVQALQSEHRSNDYASALELYEEEIRSLPSKLNEVDVDHGPDEASGRGRVPEPSLTAAAVMTELISDAQRQRQVIDDTMLAHQLQRSLTIEPHAYEDVEVARHEQARLNEIYAQAESDLEYAEQFAETREERRGVRRNRSIRQGDEAKIDESATGRHVHAMFGVHVSSQSVEDSNVAKAFIEGNVKPDSTFLDLSNNQEDSDDEGGSKLPVQKHPFDDLGYIDGCHVCLEAQYVKGFGLACGHRQCVSCTQKLFRTALRDTAMLPLRCCDLPIDMNIAFHLLSHDEASTIVQRVSEMQATNKMYCPSCSQFFNLDLVDSTCGWTGITCSCGADLCIICKSAAHPDISCEVNQSIQSGADSLVLELSRDNGWKQCPGCSSLIELRSGCNHMTCSNCRYEFCFNCLLPWDCASGQCSSGECELWEEDRLVEAGEARVQQEEAAMGAALPQPQRVERLRHAMDGLRNNEVCTHFWIRSHGYKGDCPNCSFTMWSYGMECRSQCGSTVCYTCAHHRIPQRGWR